MAPMLTAPTTEEAILLRVVPGADVLERGLSQEGIPVMVSLVPPAGQTRTPSDICCIVDVSGSMNAEAMVKTEGVSVGHGLSVLDIVKHALRTIIRNAQDCDRLALVAYSSEAAVIFGLTDMTAEGRSFTESQLEELHAAGLTNLWDGLKTGFELLKSGLEPGRLQHVLLFTDGLPNINPPRGILPMLKRLKDREGGRLPCTINTYGFGYELDSELLSQLAIEGSGAYAFIPDAGFVGTVFVNAVSNLLVTMAKDVTVTLEPLNGARFKSQVALGGHPLIKKDGGAISLSIGSLQCGQAKDLVVQMVVPPEAVGAGYLKVTVEYSTRSSVCPLFYSCTACGAAAASESAEVEPQRLRLLFVDTVRSAMQTAKLSALDRAAGQPLPLQDAMAVVQAFGRELAASPAAESEAVRALAEDLLGQVSEALSREDWYTKWGVHFLPSLMFAHLTQQCNNFKDAGVQHYGGDLFQKVRDTADDIFLSLPAPKPVAVPVRAPAPVASPFRAASPERTVDMVAYYDPYAGCFDEECMVLMADGTSRRAAEVRKGDTVATVGQAGVKVTCVVRTAVSTGWLRLAKVSDGLHITPHHPVWVNNAWRFPAEVTSIQELPCRAVCTFLLDEGAHAAIVAGIPCISLGHGLQEGAARHPFFGSRAAVLESLRRLPGFEAGIVELHTGSVERDPETGLVCKFVDAASSSTANF